MAARTMEGAMDVLYPRCAGLDVHKDSVVAGTRLADGGPTRTDIVPLSVDSNDCSACSKSESVEQPCTRIH